MPRWSTYLRPTHWNREISTADCEPLCSLVDTRISMCCLVHFFPFSTIVLLSWHSSRRHFCSRTKHEQTCTNAQLKKRMNTPGDAVEEIWWLLMCLCLLLRNDDKHDAKSIGKAELVGLGYVYFKGGVRREGIYRSSQVRSLLLLKHISLSRRSVEFL